MKQMTHFLLYILVFTLKLIEGFKCKYTKGNKIWKAVHKMALKQEIKVESDFAKSYVMNCEEMDEDYKRDLVNLIDTATMATNGISPEEKIQRITESIQKLAVSQIGLIKSIKTIIINTMQEQNKDIDTRIINAITEANKKQCEGCKAMKHATDVEKEKERQEIIDDFMAKSGLQKVAEKREDTKHKEQNKDENPFSKKNIYDTCREILLKPYIWIFGSILVFSPYGFNIIKLLIDTFAAK